MFDVRRQERTNLELPTYTPGLGLDLPRDPLSGLPDLNTYYENDIGGSLLPEEAPIALSGRDLDRFSFRFFNALSTARTRMRKIHQEAKRDRRVYKMLAREPMYEGGPDVTTPLSANKADGVLAHLKDTIEQRPLASHSAEGIGLAAARATEVAHLTEAYMEREINRSGSRERIAGHMVREAAQVGTGIARLSVARYPDEDFVQFGQTIRLENFYVDRVNVDTLRDTFCAYEYKERMYNLDEQAEMGLLDRDAVNELARMGVSSAVPLIMEEVEEDFSDSQAFAEETAIHTLATGFMFFRPEGSRRAELFEAVVHPEKRLVLAARPNSARAAFTAPPLALFRIGKQAGYLLGRGIVRRLESEQKMADNAINNHMAINNLAASPPFAYRQGSPFGRAIQRSGRKGIYPGMGIPTANSPDKGDVVIFDQFQNRGYALQDMDVAFGFADRATYTEEAIGSQSDPRKTLGQFQVEVQKGMLRLRVDVADFAYDAALALRMYWSMIVAHKLAPRGVVEIEEGGKLLAIDEMPNEEVVENLSRTMGNMLTTGEVGQNELLDLDRRMMERLTSGGIPGARRDDITISLTGTKIIADKVAELQMLMQLNPLVTSLLQAAGESSYINYHMRSIMRAMGFNDIEKRMPPDPGTEPQEPGKREAMVQQFNELQGRMSLV